jgi:plastocyanin
VEVVNNDHTPLEPPVIAKVTVTVTSVPSPATTPPPATTIPTPTPTQTSTPIPTPTAQAVSIDLIAQSLAFDKNTITVPKGARVTINFNNKDPIPHNFALYTNSSASTSIFVGQIITGPTTATYTFTAPATAGTYFFRCDVHPTAMTGSFIV